MQPASRRGAVVAHRAQEPARKECLHAPFDAVESSWLPASVRACLLRRDLAARLKRSAVSAKLLFDNLLRPLAVPAAGGILASFFCIAMIVDTLHFHPEWQPDIPVGLFTQVTIEGMSPFSVDGPDVTLQVTVDASGTVSDFELPSDGKKCSPRIAGGNERDRQYGPLQHLHSRDLVRAEGFRQDPRRQPAHQYPGLKEDLATLARQKLGQHFLSKARLSIASPGRACGEHAPLVVEIGPGRGALTERLLAHAGRVAAIELDASLAAHLRERWSAEPRLEIIEANAMYVEWSQWGEGVLAGNLPYYIATPI